MEATFNSCFRVKSADQSSPFGPFDPFVTTFYHGDEAFINAVLLTQDSRNVAILGAEDPSVLANTYGAQVNIYIGNSATYSENELCTPTPLLSATYDDIDSSWAGTGVPAYGFLQWCNMSGTYTHIVFTDVPLVDMSICNVGIFGTFFYRENLPESTVEIPAGNTLTLEVEHIKASLEYAHSLDINLRQSSSSANLSFVTFKNEASSTEVIINTEGISPGEHTLVLESFDASGSVKSTLKTD